MAERAVSTVVGYAIGIVVVAILAVSLSMAANGLVETQQERATEAKLGVYAEQLAADIETADRLAQQGDGANVSVATELPQTIGTERYAITITVVDEQPSLRFELHRSSSAVERGLATTTPIELTTVRGGSVMTTVDASSDQRMVISRA
ncbi:hypothetical protein OB905_12355 [Halobacteria archaeon AArc-dxtr1]|nr:hypothetical protein [Halobacteria archaeon AArc-dxtr1]